MKIFTSLLVPIDFSTKFLIIFLNHYKCIFPKFSKFSLNFSENFDKILKNFSKNRKNREIFMEIFIKRIHFQLIFNKILRKFLINFYCSRGAEPVAAKMVRKWSFSIVEWLRQPVFCLSSVKSTPPTTPGTPHPRNLG